MKQPTSILSKSLLSVPVRVKVIGIVIVPILILGLSLNYWVTTGLSDWLSYLLPDDRVILAMQAGSRSVLLVSVLAATAAMLFTFFMMFLLTQPLLELKRTANEVSRGNLTSRVRIWSNDEIGEVSNSFNSMLDHLTDSQEKLTQSNRYLSLMNQIALATAFNQEIHDSLFIMLKSILETVGLGTGWIYLFDDDRNKYHLATWYGVNDDEKPVILACESEELCTCQRNLISEKGEQASSIMNCDRFLIDIERGTLRHFTIPLISGEKSLGVINLKMDPSKEFSHNDLELLRNSATQISEYVSKSWLELKLNQKEAARQKLMIALIKAQENERARLARELHDGAGQMLTSLMVRMKAFERELPDEKNAAKVDRLCQNLSEVIEYIRQISYQNRPVALDKFGLEKALENLVTDMTKASGLQVETDIALSNVNLPAEIETTFYRIAQEALTNIIRHANATMIRLKLWSDPVNVNLLVTDDGAGFDVEKILSKEGNKHLGLIAMQERLDLLGGSLLLTSFPQEGTELLAILPHLEEVEYAK